MLGSWWAACAVFSRVIMHGTLIDVVDPGALLVLMQAAGFKPRDLARVCPAITKQVREHIIGLARQHGIEIEMVIRKNFGRRIGLAAILKARGTHPDGCMCLRSRKRRWSLIRAMPATTGMRRSLCAGSLPALLPVLDGLDAV